MNIEQQPWSKGTPRDREIHSKKLEQEYGYKILENNFDDYKLYFLTVVFKNNGNSNQYKKLAKSYFEFLAQKIDAKTLPNYSKKAKHALSCRIIMYPELITMPHYHGHILIKNEVNERFLKKCIKSSAYEYNIKMKRDCLSYTLDPEVLNPYRTNYIQDRNICLKIESYKMLPIDQYSEIKRNAYYCKKSFASTYELTTNDIIYAGKIPTTLH